MWVLVMFDLPTETKLQRKIYAKFRKMMLADGFQMFQFSMYIRHCPSRENAEVHAGRVRRILPPKGHVGIMTITNKQIGMMEVVYGKDATENPPVAQQLEMYGKNET